MRDSNRFSAFFHRSMFFVLVASCASVSVSVRDSVRLISSLRVGDGGGFVGKYLSALSCLSLSCLLYLSALLPVPIGQNTVCLHLMLMCFTAS